MAFPQTNKKRTLKEVEEELQSLKTNLDDLSFYIDSFFRFLPLAVCDVTPSGVIVSVNKALETVSGFAAIEIISKPLIELFVEKFQVKKLLSSARRKEIIKDQELTLISKTGERIPVSVSLAARRDLGGDLIGYFVSIRDITATKRFQQEMEDKVKAKTKDLEQSREALLNILEDTKAARLRAEEEEKRTLAIIDSLVDGLIVLDKRGFIVMVNPQAEKMLGIKEREIKGRKVGDLKNSSLSSVGKLILEEGKIKKVERKEFSPRKDVILEITTVPLEKTGWLVVFHDISREKTIERLKTEFVSIAAHQLRTPLSAIKWTLKMLLEGDLGKITKEQTSFVEKVYQSNERMIRLINDLLNVSRIEEGRFLYNPALVHIEDVIQSVIDSLEEKIKRKKIKIVFNKPTKALPRVKVDVEKMNLAITNLVDNAIKYTQEGGMVGIFLSLEKDKIKVEIQDNGIGIPKEQQSHIFTRFFRGTNAIREQTVGSGLGLFITKNIIEAHGGKIWFKSQEGKGTSFYFTLPIKEELTEFLRGF